MVGAGRIEFNGEVNLGYFPSPFALSGYVYIEARKPHSVIEFGDRVWVNNNSTFVSNGPGIVIGSRTMFGSHCEVMDSDFHNTHPDKRMDPNAKPAEGKVIIGENVLIGSNVKILKGVRIGDNCVISNGTVLTRSVPPNSLVYGNPMKCGRLMDADEWSKQKEGRTADEERFEHHE